MKQKMKRFFYITICLMALTSTLDALAQSMPERGLVRKGNRQFARERYDRSADSYRQALEHDSTSFEARYDLASAMIRTERYAEAEELLKVAAVDSLRTEGERAEAFYNLGNAQFAQQKLQEALKSYRSSLILNPDDQEAKYNYAYTKKLLEQNQDQNQDQDQNQNQDQNQDQNQNNGGGENQPQGGDQNQDKNDQSQDDNKDQGDQNQDQNGDQNKDQNQDQQGDGQGDQDEDQRDGQQPPPRSGMNKEQQEQLLNAIQAQEDKTQEKLDEKAKGVVVKGRKNW